MGSRVEEDFEAVHICSHGANNASANLVDDSDYILEPSAEAVAKAALLKQIQTSAMLPDRAQRKSYPDCGSKTRHEQTSAST